MTYQIPIYTHYGLDERGTFFNKIRNIQNSYKNDHLNTSFLNRYFARCTHSLEQKKELQIYPKNEINDLTTQEYQNYDQELEMIILNENSDHMDLVNLLNYNHQKLYDVIEIYDKYINNDNKFEILKEVYRNTHKNMISGEKLLKWIENFPNFIEDKIKTIKRKLKKKNKDMSKSRKAKERYKTSELRFRNIVRKINNLGFYGFDATPIRDRMNYLEDDEIIEEIINDISDPLGNDNDLLEIKDQDLQGENFQKSLEDQYFDYLMNKDLFNIEMTPKEREDWEQISKSTTN